ncbi:MAG: tRNA-specific 2-thiouridylase MnmA [Parcubacteria group bacterium GW2011_GWA2_47_16]|nr:MAG: tRNA-specific 2-thiouridylase MnmA [Parcubacteria group bacterium GW2011_GWA2_47_16]
MIRQEKSQSIVKGQPSKVFVGLSGGVDSSVSAALLQERGYQVTGVFIKVWTPDFIECTWKEDRLDAMRVCAKLEIPFITLDLSKEYKKEVVDYMIAEYKAGRTPNPDVMCNRYVKFGGFYKWAMGQGGDYVATGHYARLCHTNIQMDTNSTNNYELLAGRDKEKDQSYFLWTLKQEQLAHTLFPVGDLKKPEVRKLAKKFNLPTAEKKDSQGLCFMGKIDVKEFLKHYIKPKRGNVLNEEGEVVGTHDGAMFFTLGERHGFEITQKTAGDKPYYVVGKDIKKNTLIVSNNKLRGSNSGPQQVFELEDTHWINGVLPVTRKFLARLRYRQPLQGVRIKNQDSRITNGESLKVEFDDAQTGGDSGQSVVFYDGEVCLGGGVIV